jgi:hypothetical protein
MPIRYAKGVDYYVYTNFGETLTDVAVPKITNQHGPEANFHPQNLQIQSRNIPNPVGYIGGLEWVVRHRGQDMERQRQDVSTLDGNLRRGTMKNMFKTPPRIGTPTVCWGFYDSGSGVFSGMTNQHQLYIYVTPDRRRWMSELAARNPRVAGGPFARFALPGSHDAGMFDMRAVRKMLADPLFNLALITALNTSPLGPPISR